MKKLNLIILLALLIVSCTKDDDSTTINQCIDAYNLSESNITHLNTTVSWEDDNPSGIYKIEYGVSGFQIGTGHVITALETSFTLTGLLPNTTYDYYVKCVCDTDNESLPSDVKNFTTLPSLVVPEFKQHLSELNLFAGDLEDLNPSIYTFEYDLSTRLYTDYALKQRLIALPPGESMTFIGDNLPEFPDNTVIAKTFYYNIDDRDESLGKNIIETRLLIKQNGEWVLGNYKWNDAQTDATLDVDGATLPVTWIDSDGNSNNIDYEIPTSANCYTCHQTYAAVTPIGPKLKSMNFNIDGINQLQALKDRQLLSGLSDPTLVNRVPNWKDETLSNETRVRAYLDMNCAHCHSAGGFHNENYFQAMDLRYEVSFNDSHIYDKRYSIMARIQTSIEGYSMPFIGVSTPHTEAIDLIIPYLESLE